MSTTASEISTLSLSNLPERSAPSRVRSRLIILHHPDHRRVGAVAMLPELDHRRPVQLSRLEPWFGRTAGAEAGAIDDAFVSRRALVIEPCGDDLTLHAPRSTKLTVDGIAPAGSVTLHGRALREGVVLGLGDRVLLLLLRCPVAPEIAPEMIGESTAMVQLRTHVQAYASSDLPLLIHGETGSGKEGIARALHSLSIRRRKPYLAINASTIRPELAASTLFGHKRGAFTGAESDRNGAFADANGGTLFLDEIGDLPPAVQPMLLRAIEQGEVQAVGGQPRKVDVRVIAASEQNLHQIPGFRPALRYRIAQLEIAVPPLRQRAADIPLLVHHFLSRSPAAHRLEAKDEARPWLTPSVMMDLMARPWPGNVRELGAMMQRFALQYGDVAQIPCSHDREHGAAKIDTQPAVPERADNPGVVPLAEVLDAVQGNISEAARVLGVSRNTVIARMRKQGIPLATDLPASKVLSALDEAMGDVDAAAAILGVSAHGLRLVVSRLRRD